MPVIKSKTRKDNSFKQLVEYISNKGDSFQQLVGYIHKEDQNNSQNLTLLHNIIGVLEDDINGIIQAFKENDTFRRQRKNGVVQYHEVISFSPKDRKVLEKNPQILLDMSKRYLDWRAPNSLAIARPHFDTEHLHVHIMISGNQFMSKETSRVSQQEFNQIKQKLHTYQLEQYPELSNSVIEEHQVPEKQKDKTVNPELHEDNFHISKEQKMLPFKELEETNEAELSIDMDQATETEQQEGNSREAELISPYWEKNSIPSPYWEELEEEDEPSDDEETDDD